MRCYAISIRGDKQHILRDRGMFLLYRKKSLAVEACDEMNALRKAMKMEQVYSVCKVDEKEWKGFPIVYDEEFDDDDTPRDVRRYTKRTALHDGSAGSKTDSKGSKGNPPKGKGQTQALPL